MNKKYLKLGVLLVGLLAFFGGTNIVSANSCDFSDNAQNFKNLNIGETDAKLASNSSLSGYTSIYSSSDKNAGYSTFAYHVTNKAGEGKKNGSGFLGLNVNAWTCGWYWYENGNRECDSFVDGFQKNVCYAFAGKGNSENDYPLMVIIDEDGGGAPRAYFSDGVIKKNDIVFSGTPVVYYVTRPNYYTNLVSTFKSMQTDMENTAKQLYDKLGVYFNVSGSSSDYSEIFNSSLVPKFNSKYSEYKDINADKIYKMSNGDLTSLYNKMNGDLKTLSPVATTLEEVDDFFDGGDVFKSDIEDLKADMGAEHPLETRYLIITPQLESKTSESTASPIGYINGIWHQQSTEITFGYEYKKLFETEGKEAPVLFNGSSISFDFKKTMTYELIKGGTTSNVNNVKKAYDEYYKYMKYGETISCNDSNALYCSDKGTTTGFAIFASKLATATENNVSDPLNKIYELATHGAKVACKNGWQSLCDKFDTLAADARDAGGKADTLIKNFSSLISQFENFTFEFTTGDDGELECSTYISEELGNMLSFVYFLIEIFCVGGTVVLAMLDFGKAAANGDSDAVKKAWSRTIKRAIVIVILILLPVIIEWLLVDVFKVKGIDPNNPICVKVD